MAACLSESVEVLSGIRAFRGRTCLMVLSGMVALLASTVTPGTVLAAPTSARLGTPTITCWGKERAADDYKIVYTERLVVRHPSTCSNGGPYVEGPREVILHHLVWSSWGSSTATATGSSQQLGAGSPGEPREIPATATVSNIKTSGGRRWYSELSVTTSYGTGHFRLRSPTAPNYQTF
jgi:hypothetical protein